MKFVGISSPFAVHESGSDVVDGARSQQRSAIGLMVAIESHQGAIDMQVTTIGLDNAKNVFQVHGIDAAAEASCTAGRAWSFQCGSAAHR